MTPGGTSVSLMGGMPITLADVRAAAERIYGTGGRPGEKQRLHGEGRGGPVGVYRSPLHHSVQLSRWCGCEVFCKLDHLQITGSFKERGALNRLLLLSQAERRQGVICASAGNHALAVAYHGGRLGIPVTVCMPRWAPLIKVSNCRNFGAEVVFAGETFVEAYDFAVGEAARSGRRFIPGFDDPAVVAGAATAGLEIFEDLPDVDAVVVPVGGAGLIAGVGLVARELSPSTRVIGVEPEHCASLTAAVAAGAPVRVASRPTLADGLAVAQVGSVPLEVLLGPPRRFDELVLVSEPQIARAVLRLMELEKMVVEGAGAASLAGLLKLLEGGDRAAWRGRNVVLLLCGGNIDVTVLNRIIDRGLAADGRLCRVTCRTSDRPGSLNRMTAVFARLGASVIEIFHDRFFGPADVAEVAITAVLETRDRTHARDVVEALRADGIDVAHVDGFEPSRG